MENPDTKILHKNHNFELVEKDGMVGIKPLFMNVVIMPFTCDENKLPLLVGVLEEKNPFRDGGISVSLITGTSEDEDPDVLSTAMRELGEESGFSVDDPDRWYYLGTCTSSKFVDHEQPCFAVDVSGIEKGEAKTDGSEIEKSANFKMIPANDVVKAKDIFIPGLFLKLFKFVMGMDLSLPSDKSGMGNIKGHNLEI